MKTSTAVSERRGSRDSPSSARNTQLWPSNPFDHFGFHSDSVEQSIHPSQSHRLLVEVSDSRKYGSKERERDLPTCDCWYGSFFFLFLFFVLVVSLFPRLPLPGTDRLSLDWSPSPGYLTPYLLPASFECQVEPKTPTHLKKKTCRIRIPLHRRLRNHDQTPPQRTSPTASSTSSATTNHFSTSGRCRAKALSSLSNRTTGCLNPMAATRR